MHLKLYKQFEYQLQRAKVQTVSIPERVLTAASLAKDEDASRAELDVSIIDCLRVKLPSKLFSSLADFQKVGVHWGSVKKGGRCLIGELVQNKQKITNILL